LTNPLFTVPLSQSVCSIWTVSFSQIEPFGWLICPLGGVQAIIAGEVASFRLIQTIFALLLFIIPIAIIGNFFCGWVCPFGTMIDSFDGFIRKYMPKIEAKREARSKANREAVAYKKAKTSSLCPACPIGRILINKYGMAANGILLASIIGVALFKPLNVFCTVCPIGISTRGLIHLKATTTLTKSINPFFLELLIIPVIAIVLSLREKRFWCNKLCPVGALLNLGAAFSPFFKPKINEEKCVMKGCPKDCTDYKIDYCSICRKQDDRKCERVCPQNINLLEDQSRLRCTRCMECYVACERGAIEIKFISMPDALVPIQKFIKKSGKNRKSASCRVPVVNS
jgi:polyferredoxin